jgi:hypothetical protein
VTSYPFTQSEINELALSAGFVIHDRPAHEPRPTIPVADVSTLWRFALMIVDKIEETKRAAERTGISLR